VNRAGPRRPPFLLALLAFLLGGILSPLALAYPEGAQKDETEGGEHWRIPTAEGVIHVWRPGHYDGRTAGIVVYVHGYYTRIDDAWMDHNLCRQFRESRKNALFIAPEAPVSAQQEVRWGSLKQLLDTVRVRAVAPPAGPIVIVGHSGAYRTIAKWLESRRVSGLVLLDAAYGKAQVFRSWWRSSSARASARWVLVADDTLDESVSLVRGFKGVARRSTIPADRSGFSRRERQARILLLQSQYEHMELVSNGKVIPVVLDLTPVPNLLPPPRPAVGAVRRNPGYRSNPTLKR